MEKAKESKQQNPKTTGETSAFIVENNLKRIQPKSNSRGKRPHLSLVQIDASGTPDNIRRLIADRDIKTPEEMHFNPCLEQEDTENEETQLRCSIAELLIATEAFAGRGADFLPGMVSLDIGQFWTSPQRYPFLSAYRNTHALARLAAAAETVIHYTLPNAKNTSPWLLTPQKLWNDEFGQMQQLRRVFFPVPVASIANSRLVHELPGEQEGPLAHFFAKSLSGSRCVHLPLVGIHPAAPFGGMDFTRFMFLPLGDYPLFGLPALHHSGRHIVIVTPSMAECLANQDNSEAVVVSWLGGTATVSAVDFTPLKGHTVIYCFNPNTFGTAQEALDCFEMVDQRLEKLEITCQIMLVKEETRCHALASLADDSWETIFPLTCFNHGMQFQVNPPQYSQYLDVGGSLMRMYANGYLNYQFPHEKPYVYYNPPYEFPRIGE